MDIDANKVIDKLGNQIKQMAMTVAVKDLQIDILQQEIVKLKSEKEIEANKEQTA